MAIITTNTNLSLLTIVTGETIEIRNGATLTIDSTPSVLPGNITCITSGKLRIENNSTTTPIRVPLSDMNKDFRFEGNGVLEVRGQMMELGTGTGAAQSFNIGTLYSGIIDDLTYVEIETAVGSGLFEPWVIIPIDPKYYHVGRTDGGGAVSEFIGTPYEAGKVAFWHDANRTLSFGNNVNGWSVPNGCKIRIPNILITNDQATDASLIHAIISEGTPTGGTFTITITNRKTNVVLGTTAAIAFNASAATIDTAIEAITGAGTISASGGALPTAVSITLAGSLASTPLALTVNSSVTGGTDSIIYTRENSAGNLTLIDLNPSGTLDAENCMFSQKIRFTNSSHSRVRLLNVGAGSDAFHCSNSNGTVSIKNFSLVVSPYVTAISNGGTFQVFANLGSVSLDNIKTSCRRSNSRVLLSTIPQLEKCDNITAYSYSAVNRLVANRVSIDLATVTPNIVFNNIVAIGGRLAALNLVGNIFTNLKVADGHFSLQTSLATTSSIVATNCINLKFLSPSMAGIMASRNYVFSTDVASLNIDVYNGNFDGGNNTIGLLIPNGKNTNFYNTTITNVRGGALIDQPAAYTASGMKANKVFSTFSTSQLGDGLDVAQDAEYDLVSTNIVGITETFASVENFVGGNYADPGVTPTTGHVTFGPFGRGNGLTLTGAAYTNQTGRLYFTNIGDTAEIEIPFAIHGITSFQNVVPFLRVELQGAVCTTHVITNNEGITGGTFTISVFDNAGVLLGTTAALAFNASTSTVQTAIRNISTAINLSTVSGSLSAGFVINLIGTANYFGSVTVDGSLLTGGTNPNIAYAVGRTALIGTSESYGLVNTLEFALKTKNGTYGSYQSLNGTNLSTAIAALTGYSANEGLFIKLRFISGVNNPFQFLTQISLPTNINPSLWVLDDSFINIKGLDATDIVEVKKVSDNTTLYTFTGAGIKEFGLGVNYNESIYFLRKDSLGNILMSTIKSPVKLTIGDNGTANLFYGPQVQLAESSTVGTLGADITAINVKIDLNNINIQKINENVKRASRFKKANLTF